MKKVAQFYVFASGHGALYGGRYAFALSLSISPASECGRVGCRVVTSWI